MRLPSHPAIAHPGRGSARGEFRHRSRSRVARRRASSCFTRATGRAATSPTPAHAPSVPAAAHVAVELPASPLGTAAVPSRRAHPRHHHRDCAVRFARAALPRSRERAAARRPSRLPKPDVSTPAAAGRRFHLGAQPGGTDSSTASRSRHLRRQRDEGLAQLRERGSTTRHSSGTRACALPRDTQGEGVPSVPERTGTA